MYLAETHFLQVVPDSLLLSKAPEKPIPDENDGRFVVLGAPVYYEAGVRAWAWARAGPGATPGSDKQTVLGPPSRGDEPVVRGVQS